MSLALALFPWILFGALCAWKLREPDQLPSHEVVTDAPKVTVVVPARNEALNIRDCITSLAASTYPDFEIIVVDDRSDDETAAIVEGIDAGNATRLRLIRGEALPEGWYGKPWACWQGAQAATGDVLLFTDADTTHGPELLTNAVGELHATDASMVSLVGDQVMGSFWERLIQPQIFVMIAMRYPNPKRLFTTPLADPERWPEAIANGQFIMVRREDYQNIEGHRSVRGEVVEDLRLAQRLVQSGYGLLLRGARKQFSTRMYRSLEGLIEGWSKNLWTGSRQSVNGPFGAILLPIGVISLLGLWVIPSVVLGVAALGLVSGSLLLWAAIATAIGVLFWAVASVRMGAPWYYGFLAPLGTVVTVGILLRSAVRGSRIEWKGRRYGSD